MIDLTIALTNLLEKIIDSTTSFKKQLRNIPPFYNIPCPDAPMKQLHFMRLYNKKVLDDTDHPWEPEQEAEPMVTLINIKGNPKLLC